MTLKQSKREYAQPMKKKSAKLVKVIFGNGLAQAAAAGKKDTKI